MAEDFYSDTPDPSPEPEEKSEADDSNVALLPKSFFPADKELKPGSTCTVRVQEVQEDQVLVTYEREEAGEVEAEPEMAAPPMVDEEMSAMMA